MLLAACQNPKNELVPNEVKTSTQTSPNSDDSNQRVSREGVTFRKGRLVFDTEQTFYNTMVAVSDMSSEDKEAFEKQYSGYTSWRKYNADLENDENAPLLYYSLDEIQLPTFYTTLLNNKREYQIGTQIVYLEEGKAYLIPENQEEPLKVNGWFSATTLGEVPTSVVDHIAFNDPNSEKTNSNTKGNTNNGATERGNYFDAKYQFQYSRGDHTFKQVFEVAAISPPFFSRGINFLYFRQKLEYWKRVGWFRSDWAQAGEFKTMIIDCLNGNVSYPNKFAKLYLCGALNNPYTSYSQSSVANLEVTLGQFYSTTPTNASSWTFNLGAGRLEMFLSSHNQCTIYPIGVAYCPNSQPHLMVLGASWVK
jgi:hypothetical protein